MSASVTETKSVTKHKNIKVWANNLVEASVEQQEKVIFE